MQDDKLSMDDIMAADSAEPDEDAPKKWASLGIVVPEAPSYLQEVAVKTAKVETPWMPQIKKSATGEVALKRKASFKRSKKKKKKCLQTPHLLPGAVKDLIPLSCEPTPHAGAMVPVPTPHGVAMVPAVAVPKPPKTKDLNPKDFSVPKEAFPQGKRGANCYVVKSKNGAAVMVHLASRYFYIKKAKNGVETPKNKHWSWGKNGGPEKAWESAKANSQWDL